MSDVARCACGATLGTQSQAGLPGTNTAAKCIRCVTADHVKHMLTMLPDEDDREFDELSEFEQKFLPSVRSQFASKGTLSERQIETLERLYAKH